MAVADEIDTSPHKGSPDHETVRIVVPAKQSKERIDVYLTHQIQNATRSKVRSGIDEGLVLVNGKKAKASHHIAPGDVIEITLPRPPF
jgi:23S rRNA pseudouridine1911/1915/1917 synthase